eukprot:symbB.v1.2.031242.t1/scaffold3606.1/size53369/1
MLVQVGLAMLSLCAGSEISANSSLELPKTFLSTSSPTSSASLTNKSGLGDENVGNESLLMAMPSNRTENVTSGRWKQLIKGREEAPVQSVIVLILWLCCCSFCCYSATHQDEVRTMILKRDQRAQMAEIAEKEMVTRDHTVGLSTSFDGLLSSGQSSTYTPPRL